MKLKLSTFDDIERALSVLENHCIGVNAKHINDVKTIRMTINCISSKMTSDKFSENLFRKAVKNIKQGLNTDQVQEAIYFVEEFFNTIYTGNFSDQ